MSNNTVVSVHETYRETYHARFCIVYNRIRNHGWNIVIMDGTYCLDKTLSD